MKIKPFIEKDKISSQEILNLEEIFNNYQQLQIFPNYSYREFQKKLEQTVLKLTLLNLRPGSILAVQLPTSPEFFAVFLASLLLKLIFLPLHPQCPEKEKEELKKRLFYSYLWNTESEHNSKELAENSTTLTTSSSLPNSQSWKIPLNQEASLILTSGSTGTPKAVLHTVGNYYYSALGTIEFLEMKEQESWPLTLPTHHVGGLLIFWRTFLSGGVSILLSQDPQNLLHKFIIQYSPTYLSLVPTQLIRLLRSPLNQELLQNLQRAKAILLGGGPISSLLLHSAYSYKINIFPTYGMTESCAQVTMTSATDTQKIPHAGKILPYRELRIDGEGNIWIRGKTLFKGYQLPEKLERPFDSEGWFRTSDRGSCDLEGNLRLLERNDTIFISGGENISPSEIEEVLKQHPSILEAKVIAFPHTDFGQVPLAFIHTNHHSDEFIRELKNFLRSYLPSYKIPKQFLLYPLELPQNQLKLSKALLLNLAHQRLGETL